MREATRLMANRMSDELRTEFGIATNVTEITETEWHFGGCGCTAPGLGITRTTKVIGYKLDLSKDAASNAAAQKTWDDLLAAKTQSIISSVEPGVDPGPSVAAVTGYLNEMRNFIKSFLSTDHEVKMKTGGDVSLGGFSTSWWSRSSVEGNPYNWFVKDAGSGTWVDPLTYGSHLTGAAKTAEESKIRLTWGPTMLFVHEMEHIVGKTMTGAALPGPTMRVYEEDDVMKDVDLHAQVHPDLTSRDQYTVGPEQYTITGTAAPGAKPTSSPPTAQSWIRWPSQRQLDTGVK
jgi:hypothetical protein